MGRHYYVLTLFSLLTWASCKKNDVVLTNETFTTLTIKYDNLPDFSFAGYEKSEKPLPLVPVKVIVSPREGDDGAAIQSAIDSVSKLPITNGFRGTVLLTKGTYEVQAPLFIRANGVVLRGQGQGADGTIIKATGKSQYTLITLLGDATEVSGAQSAIEAEQVRVGAVNVPVQDASSFRPGDSIVLWKTVNDHWINSLDMAQYGWEKNAYQIGHRRVIKRVEKDVLTLDIPMVDQIQKEFGGGTVVKTNFPGRISQSGVENLRLQSVFDSDVDEQHAWTAIKLVDVINCWVRNVTALYFGFSCVTVSGKSDFNTIQDCAMIDPKSLIDGNRRYSFYIESGMGNIFQRCFTKGGRHDFSTGATVTGPNVFLDCFAIETWHETGPHHRWATGILYDNVYAGYISAYNRTSWGTGHGWAGAQNMFWNCHATKSFQIDSPPGAVNWCIGCRGASSNGNGYWASWGIPVLPRSLFLEQLKIRLGNTTHVTVPAQRSTSIWNELEHWSGTNASLNPLIN